MTLGTVARVSHLLMGVFLLYGGYLQTNDPQPLKWVSLYVAAGLLALLTAADQPRAPLAKSAVGLLAGIFSGVCLLCALSIGASQAATERLSLNALAWIESEHGRDISGLIIIGLELLAVAYAQTSSRPTTSRRRSGKRNSGASATTTAGARVVLLWSVLSMIVALAGISAAFWLPNYLHQRGVQGTPEYCAFETRKW